MGQRTGMKNDFKIQKCIYAENRKKVEFFITKKGQQSKGVTQE